MDFLRENRIRVIYFENVRKGNVYKRALRSAGHPPLNDFEFLITTNKL
jgi:hypothetical protein